MIRNFILAMATCLAVGLAPSNTSAAEAVGLGGKCLDVRGGEVADGQDIVLWPCNGRDNQSRAIR